MIETVNNMSLFVGIYILGGIMFLLWLNNWIQNKLGRTLMEYLFEATPVPERFHFAATVVVYTFAVFGWFILVCYIILSKPSKSSDDPYFDKLRKEKKMLDEAEEFRKAYHEKVRKAKEKKHEN